MVFCFEVFKTMHHENTIGTVVMKNGKDQPATNHFCKNKDRFGVPLGTKPAATIPSARLSTKSVELVRLWPNDPGAAV